MSETDPEYDLGVVRAEEMFDSLLLDGLSQRAALCMVSEAVPGVSFIR